MPGMIFCYTKPYMSERIPKQVSFSDYPHAPAVEVPPEANLNDGFAYTREEVQNALAEGSEKFRLTVIEVDEGQQPLE
jgi:hypothetical protein